MTDAPQIWHYGLIARSWAEFNEPEPGELAFYQGVIERDGQPALDLGCGTGRLLLPLLRAGLDVDGCDISPDMLAYCRRLAARAGLEPRLYQQAMHELDLPRPYRTIFICDSFGLGGQRQHDAEALRRCHRHLAPGGVLAFSLELPYSNAGNWSNWLPEERRHNPRPWPATGERRRMADGDELEERVRLVDLDPLEQQTTIQMRAALWRDGQRVDGGGAHHGLDPLPPQRGAAAVGAGGVRGGHGLWGLHRRSGDGGRHVPGVRRPQGRLRSRMNG